MDETEELLQALNQQATPGAADVLEARQIILDLLADGGTHHERDLQARMHAARGIPNATYDEQVVVDWTESGWTLPTGDEPGLARLRTDAAIRQALTALVREQVVVPTEGNLHGASHSSVTVRQNRGGSATGPIQIERILDLLPNQATDCRWRLLHAADNPRTQLARTPISTGLDDLLGVRGLEVLSEAVACFHAGRFIAAVDLLAAASEAAWFGIGAAAAGHDTKLDKLVADGDGAAEVIERAVGVIATERTMQKTTRHELHAQAVRFRDLRNYGLHPVGSPDGAREPAFTEAGAAALFMTAPRYFQQLDSARTALTPAGAP